MPWWAHNGVWRHLGHVAARFPARWGIPARVPPQAEGPAGPGKLQFPACLTSGAPAYGSNPAGERVGLKRCSSPMETNLLAPRRSYRLVDGLGARLPGQVSKRRWAVQERDHASEQGLESLSLPSRVQSLPPDLQVLGLTMLQHSVWLWKAPQAMLALVGT